MAKSKTKANEEAKRSEKGNPIGIVAGFQQIVQDLLVPELKAIQVTLQHHGELIQGLQRQMEAMQRQMDERFTAMQQQNAKNSQKFGKPSQSYLKPSNTTKSSCNGSRTDWM